MRTCLCRNAANATIYRRLLRLYPERLRAEFGDDIVDLFLDEIDAARRVGGWRGVVRIWGTALREASRYCLVGQSENPLVAVPVLTVAFLFATQSPLLIRSFEQGTPGFADAVFAVSINALVAAATSWVVARRNQISDTVALNLGR